MSLISALAFLPRRPHLIRPKKQHLSPTELARVETLAGVQLFNAQREAEAERVASEVMSERLRVGWMSEEGEDSPLDSDGDGDLEIESDHSATINSPGLLQSATTHPNGPTINSTHSANVIPTDAPADSPMADDDDDLAIYNLDTYDSERTALQQPDSAAGPFSSLAGLTYYRSNGEDPYIVLSGEKKLAAEDQDSDDDDEDREELDIRPSDNMIVTAKTEDDISQLDIYIYDDSAENLYVHHDLLLPAFPLCLEWMDFAPCSSGSSAESAIPDATTGQFGNYIAVGTFDPTVEIWNLDVLDGVYPDALLGPPQSQMTEAVALGTGKKKRRVKAPLPPSAAHHIDAVLAISWNRSHRNLIATGSADKTVKLWDLSAGPMYSAIRSFDQHTDKVQAVRWNQADPTVLLTGGFDKFVRTFDSRSPTDSLCTIVDADVEVCVWDPWQIHSFYVSLENGNVHYYDGRMLAKNAQRANSVFTIAAHDGAVSALDVSPHVRGCLATGGTDKLVKIWNIEEDENKRQVSMVVNRDLQVGRVFSLSFSPDDPLVLAAAGSASKIQIWDVATNAGARQAFGRRLKEHGKELRERESSTGGLIGLVDDDSEEEDEEE